MNLRFLMISALLCLGLSGPAAATKVVLVSSEIPAKTITDEKVKSPVLHELKASKEKEDVARRERLLKELRELYKQGRPENE